jgi:hypothetical protein
MKPSASALSRRQSQGSSSGSGDGNGDAPRKPSAGGTAQDSVATCESSGGSYTRGSDERDESPSSRASSSPLVSTVYEKAGLGGFTLMFEVR